MPELDLGDPDLSPSQQALLHELAASCTTQAELDELLSSSDLERLLSLQELQDIIDTPEPILTSLPIPGKSIYPPFHHEPKWRIPVATITFKGYDAQALELFTHFSVHVASSLGIPTSKVYTLPKQRRLWTVLKSPFVFKKAQENFERITHSRGIKAWDADLGIVNIWTSMLRQHAMPGVGMRIVKWTRLEVGGGSQDLKDVEGEVRGVFKAQDAERVRKLGAQIVESELADQSESEMTLAEENSAGDKPAEEQPAEGERAEQRVEGELVGQSEPEVKLEEEKLVEDKPVEEKLTEGQSAEDTLTEVKLAEDKLAEGKSAEGESKPTEGKPTEGKPAEGRQAEDKLAEQKLIEEQRTTEA